MPDGVACTGVAVHILVRSKAEDLILVVGEVTAYTECPVSDGRLIVQCDLHAPILHRADISVVGLEGEFGGHIHLHQDIGRLAGIEVDRPSQSPSEEAEV